jgi:hypothetical protein
MHRRAVAASPYALDAPLDLIHAAENADISEAIGQDASSAGA